MSDSTLKILVVEPMKPCKVREIPDTLEAMQQIVGGCIESVSFEREAIICNENGKLLDLPFNRPLLDESGLIPLDILQGTFFIAGVSGESFVSLTDEQIQRYSSTDNHPDRRAPCSARNDPEGATAPSGERECHLRGAALACRPVLTLSGRTMRHHAWPPHKGSAACP